MDLMFLEQQQVIMILIMFGVFPQWFLTLSRLNFKNIF